MDVTPVIASYKSAPKASPANPDADENFASVFDAALNLVDETNTLQNKAEAEEVKFSLGLSDNTHDMMIASRKAQVALQYTNAIRNGIVQAYQQLMQMQI